jgi:hypothetical protein
MFEAVDSVFRPVDEFELHQPLTQYRYQQAKPKTLHIFRTRHFVPFYFATEEHLYFKIRTPNNHIPLVLVFQKTDTVADLLDHFHELNRISLQPVLLDGEESINPQETLEACFNRNTQNFTFVMGDFFVKLE